MTPPKMDIVAIKHNLPKGVTIQMLREIGEWMALGLYEGMHLPFPRVYGIGYRRLYENMPVLVPENRLIIPHEPFPYSWNRESHEEWSAVSRIIDFNHNSGIRINQQMLKERKKRFPQYAHAMDKMAAGIAPIIFNSGGYTHTNPDIRRVVSEGFNAIECELDEELVVARQTAEESRDNAEAQEAYYLLLAAKDYAIGVRAYHARTVKELRTAVRAAAGDRRAKLKIIADSFSKCFLEPSKTFVQGLLAVNFVWLLDGQDSIGRYDQALGWLFEHDIKKGKLDLGFARELIDEVFQNFERFNGWNMQIGGWTPDGKDGTNALTRELIEACGRNHLRKPNVAFRVTTQTPDDALVAALKVLRDGSGRPAIYNDDLYVKTLQEMPLGLTPEDAREIGFGGCTEIMISGLSNCGSLEGMLNLANALEVAMYDGYDPVQKLQLGPHTGKFENFETFDQFYAAVKRQIQWMNDSFVAAMNPALKARYHKGDPKLYRTLFTRDCIKRHKSFEAGGARYNWSVVSYWGIANIVDSLVAVRDCVFEKKTISNQDLMAALVADFKGYESVQRELKAAPKFGNDDPRVDELARDIMQYTWSELLEHEPPRGGRYIPSCILFTTYDWAGSYVGATPDGRNALQVLTDSVGPSQGQDVNGPTAMLRSVAHLPLWLAVGTPVLNVRFQKQMIENETALDAVKSLVRSFFEQGGLQVQISVMSKEEMLEAQSDPDKHRDMIVRVGGYSEYFTRLSKNLQDSIIARTEHTV